MVSTRRDIKQIGHIENDVAYTMVEASRLMTASVEMLRDYVRKGLIKRIDDDKAVIRITGAELVRFIDETARQKKAAVIESAERARERERERRRKQREEVVPAATQGTMFKPVPAPVDASVNRALLAEIRALRAEVAALKR